jgi:hypothetical protein
MPMSYTARILVARARSGICYAGIEKLLKAERQRYSLGQHCEQADDFDLEGLFVLSAFACEMTAQKVLVHGGCSVQ